MMMMMQGGAEALERQDVLRQHNSGDSMLEMMAMAWMGQTASEDEVPNQHSRSKLPRRLLAQHDEREAAEDPPQLPLRMARRLTGSDAGTCGGGSSSSPSSSPSTSQDDQDYLGSMMQLELQTTMLSALQGKAAHPLCTTSHNLKLRRI